MHPQPPRLELRHAYVGTGPFEIKCMLFDEVKGLVGYESRVSMVKYSGRRNVREALSGGLWPLSILELKLRTALS